MRRSTTVVVAAVFMALPVSALAPASAAPKPPAYNVSLTHDSTCAFTATATWSGVSVGSVDLFWYIDGVYWATSQAPATGPNAGVIKGRTAVFQTGSLDAAVETHPSQALVTFFARDGQNLGQTWSNVDNANCALPPPA